MPTRQLVALALSTLLPLAPVLDAHAQDAPAAAQPTLTLRVESNIVLTNVVARDKKTGAVVRDLKASDFTILENNKPQKLASFDFQAVDNAPALQQATISGRTLDTKAVADLLNQQALGTSPAALRDHRLIVLFFDLSSMQPEDIDRAVESAQQYIRTKMQPADLVAVTSLSTSLSMDQDFTNDRDLLLRAVGKYNGTEGTGFANGGTTGSTSGTADDSSSFAADDTEYNSLNTDRELFAISTIARSLQRIDQRKSMLYFSGGLSRNGIENQASMRTATNAAAKANMAIYSVDTRGLQALPPVGDASQGSLRGTSAYSGGAQQSNLDSNFASQEVLGTLASDTGGKFFADSNDFAPAFQQVQHDTEAYYILGFRSSNPARDGAFRHLSIRVNRPNITLQYRPGYFAPADFQHQKTEDREQALQDQLRSDLPATDVSLYLEALYFRLPDHRCLVPISLIVPGSQIPFLKNGDKTKATLDIAGQIKDAAGILVGTARETVKLALDSNQQPDRRNIQYSTAFTLAPGRYHLKFVVRENQTGAMGSFETDLQVPDLTKSPLKLSSIVLASQRTPVPQGKHDQPAASPLIRDGQQWVPNIPHVFRNDGHLFLLYELYDPTHEKPAPNAPTPQPAPGLGRRPAGAVRVFTSIELLQGGSKVYETPLVQADTINTPDRNSIAFAFDIPLTPLKPGTYIAQVNVIDDAGGTFTFPRLAMRILPTPTTTTTPPPTPAPSSPSDAPATPAPSPAAPTTP